jgi:hypothetical protein
MLITAAVATVSAAGLALVIGTLITFGHRFADVASKLDDKPKSDEVQDMQISIRTEEASPHLNRLWAFLDETALKDPRLRYDVSALFSDVSRRNRLNDLVNGLERAHMVAVGVLKAWRSVRTWNRRISRILYVLAAADGVVGYGLIYLGLQDPPQVSLGLFYYGIGALVVLTASLFVLAVLCLLKAGSNQKTYDEARMKYLLEGVHISE